MSGDYSRERFDAHANVSGVRMQQGRVQLDADWNEWVAVVDRRFRAEAIDIFGREPDGLIQGVAVYPRVTPDAFRISAASGDLTIGRGRLYVDGLLAENHGAGDLEYDRLLDETRGIDPVPYGEQPYLPDAPAISAEGSALAYLDAWQREVTHLQDPGLVEVAVGVDTTTRLQTVWQVRLLEGIGSTVTCSTPDASIPGWADLTAPSAGRLTTAAVGVPPEDDPCEMPPSGGYRGVENRLYRVQIHDGGGLGEATFKWSRDNATVASGVVEVISATELRLESLGRDAVLRFNTGDWVEVVDDRRELTGVDGDPARRHGAIRQITTDESTSTITLNDALPADLVPSGVGEDTADARHLLVRKWDQAGSVYDADGDEYFGLDAGGDGVIPVPSDGTTLMLEAGIQVTFSLADADGVFHAGDYWTFAARTTDASVEELQAEPPRGPHHHFARLGVITWPSDVQDCRRPWPPDVPTGGGDCGGCCTVHVSAEEYAADPTVIQQAVDSLQATGGTICLGAGVFAFGERTVRVYGARSITIKGQGSSTQVLCWNLAFDVRQSFLVSIQDMLIMQVQQITRPAIALDLVLYGRYERLQIVRSGEGNAPAIGLSRVAMYLDIEDNTIASPVGIGAWFERDEAQYLLMGAVRIARNTITAAAYGVHFDGPVLFGADVRLTENRVGGSAQAAVMLSGASAPNVCVDVAENIIVCPGAGIVAGVSGLRIDRNDLSGPASGDVTDLREGIRIQSGYDKAPLGATSICGNRIRNVSGGAILIAHPVTDALVRDNVVEDAGGGVLFTGRGGGEAAAITGNSVRSTRSDAQANLATAILAQRVQALSIAHNTVEGVGDREAKGLVAGILVAGCHDVSVTQNHVSGISAMHDGQMGVGIMVAAPFVDASVTENIVRSDAESVEARWSGIVVGLTGEGDVQPIGGDLVALRTTRTRTMYLAGGYAMALETDAEDAGVHQNLVEGRGALPAVHVGIRGECLLGDNQVRRSPGGMPAVVVTADLAAVHSNRVRAGDLSMVLNVDQKRSTVVGNITTGPIQVGGGPLPAPWAAINVTA